VETSDPSPNENQRPLFIDVGEHFKIISPSSIPPGRGHPGASLVPLLNLPFCCSIAQNAAEIGHCGWRPNSLLSTPLYHSGAEVSASPSQERFTILYSQAG